MREIRKSGSEGGGAHKLSLPLSHTPHPSPLTLHPESLPTGSKTMA